MIPTDAVTVLVSWPSAPLTERLVRKSLDVMETPTTVVSSVPDNSHHLLQWSTYDSIDHELVHLNRETVLSSSYIIRKALIRKHFLSRCVHSYLTKHPASLLKHAIPTTWDMEISYADELDEMWSDELWDLGESLDDTHNWYILKPGMADRGMGIRLFNSKETLQSIFEGFEVDSDDEEAELDNTAVMTSQLRHFVIQVSHLNLQEHVLICVTAGIHVDTTSPRSASSANRQNNTKYDATPTPARS